MKKRNLFTLGLMGVSLLFMTSCSDDDDDDPAPIRPSFSVVETNTGNTGGEMVIAQGETLEFAWDARRGDNDLKTFEITTSGANSQTPIPTSYDGNTFPYEIDDAYDEIYIDTVAFTAAGVNLGLTTYTFSVIDEAGRRRDVTFDVEVMSSTTELSQPIAFEWSRVGGNPGIGLDQFGLKWTSNSATSAIVTLNEATKLVQLQNSTWVDIDTVEDLANAIEDATAIDQYTGVSVEQSGTYNDVLGVRFDGDYYILNIQEAAVTSTSEGTSVVINGEYKN